MAIRGRKRPKANKSRLEDRKVRIEIAAGLVAIVVAVVGLVEVFHPFRRSPEAQLEVVDFFFDNQSAAPKLVVKLRNTGGSTALLKKAELLFDDVKVEDDEAPAGAEVEPVLYHWLITLKDLSQKSSSMRLARKIDANDADNIEFLLGYERLKSKFSARARLRLEYNTDDTVVTIPTEVTLQNNAGMVPVFALSKDTGELLRRLQEVEDGYTARQVIEELAGQKYAAAAPVIRNYLQSPDPDVRVAALNYYSQVKYPEVIPDIVKAINDDNALVREGASKVMRFYGVDVVNQLEQLSHQSEPEVRELAIYVLGEINAPESEPLLLKALEDRGIAKVIFGEKVLVSASAVRALAKIKSQKAVPKILALLHNEENISVKLAAVEAAAELNIKDATSELIRLLRHKDERVRRSASDALVRLTGKNYAPS